MFSLTDSATSSDQTLYSELSSEQSDMIVQKDDKTTSTQGIKRSRSQVDDKRQIKRQKSIPNSLENETKFLQDQIDHATKASQALNVVLTEAKLKSHQVKRKKKTLKQQSAALSELNKEKAQQSHKSNVDLLNNFNLFFGESVKIDDTNLTDPYISPSSSIKAQLSNGDVINPIASGYRFLHELVKLHTEHETPDQRYEHLLSKIVNRVCDAEDEKEQFQEHVSTLYRLMSYPESVEENMTNLRYEHGHTLQELQDYAENILVLLSSIRLVNNINDVDRFAPSNE